MGAASALIDRLTMGAVAVTSSDPVKRMRPNKVSITSASYHPGGRVSSTLASTCPAASLAVKVTRDSVEEGFA